ncbi:MAG: DUF1286 domain-containing protein [Candidatus Aramenus sulfurataquae]|uniref:DUF1286 domain-containing protein n=2 Tax=Candidatus Aramenus sulfurataquae TaxID=1326980 RepID=A0AAE3FL32_9CREN|nr:DUF1286 domain-containing protein [Candidatus Aramenus sulfurataquae]
MQLRTHYVFTLGLLILADSFLLRNFILSLSLSLVVSVLANSLIDGLGHRELHTPKGDIITRTPLTHTFPRSVVWGIISSLPLVASIYYFNTLQYEPSAFKLIALSLVDGAIAGPSHLVLDVFTEKGVFVKRGGKWRRFALAHFSYSNPFANGVAIAVGLVMIYLAFSVGRP